MYFHKLLINISSSWALKVYLRVVSSGFISAGNAICDERPDFSTRFGIYACYFISYLRRGMMFLLKSSVFASLFRSLSPS